MERIRIKNLFLYIGFFIIAASLVMLQILYARASSIAFGFGFEFLIISLVILGIGLGGILVFFLLNNLKSLGHVNSYIVIASLVYVVSIPAPFLLIEAGNNSSIFLFLLAGFLTYFFGGIIASLLFRYYSKKISKLYFLSLSGSAFGALGTIALLEFFSMPKTIVFLLVLSSFSVLFYMLQAGPGKKLTISAITLVLAVLVFTLSVAGYLRVVCPDRDDMPILTKSDSISQVDIYPDSESSYTLMRDCGSRTPVINYNTTDESELNKYARMYFPFPTNNFSSALIVGSAGGGSVIQAVRAGIKNITAVEINPLIIEGTEILEKPDNIYYHDSVELFIEEGRAFISASQDKYDLIYLLALQGSRIGYGAHVFSENYLYTKEAFDSYFEHLNENGILAIGVRKLFLQRFIETAVINLLEEGVDPTKRVISFEDMRGGDRGLVLIKSSDFSEPEVNDINKRAVELGVDARLLTDADIERYQGGHALTDNSPYFYFRSREAISYNPGEQKGVDKYIEWMNTTIPDIKNFSPILKYILLFFIIILFAYLLTALIPLFKSKSLRSKNIIYLLGFFSAIGIGFVTLELSFIHKFTLFLGHPILSFSVALTSVLFFGGLGSLITGRFKERDTQQKLVKIILLLVLVVAFFTLFINFALSRLIFLDGAYKIIFAISALSLPSFLMGMIFPLGLKLVLRTSKKLIPWMLGIDGITSVLGGILSFVISLMLGFNAALILGIIVYTFALLMVLRIKYEI